MKEKLKTHKLVGIKNTEHMRLLAVGKLKMKGLAHDAYYANNKNYFWIKRGNKV